MSGICGILEDGREFDRRLLTAMLDALSLPGETESRECGGKSVLLGVARRWNFQQIAHVEGVSVVADADLLGFESPMEGSESAPESQGNFAKGIATLYRLHGVGFLEKLHGAFSLALWDSHSRRLILAVDRFGFRSLYWRREGPTVLFASRLSAVRAVQKEIPQVNNTAVMQFLLFSAVPAPLSIDRGTARIPPGTFISFEHGRTTEHRYWDLQYPESTDIHAGDWSSTLREEMRNAVQRHLENCQPESTGCYLSGGTDSSSVVAFVSEKHKPAQSFSVAFEEQGFSEIDFARTAAACFRTRHREKWLKAEGAINAVEKLLEYYDEPFANSSAVGSYYCALMAKENGVNTLLAGDGGDEIFGGNERYARDKYFSLYHSVPAWLRRGVVEPLARVLPESESMLSLPRRYLRRANMANPRRILSYNFFLSTPSAHIFEPDFIAEVGEYEWLTIAEQHFERPTTSSELNRLLYLDVKMTLGDNDLRKVSGTAEIAGVNVRYPLLDDRLVSFAGRIPSTLKLKGFEKRFIFKQAMKGILPDSILYKKKHGFGVPLAQWMLNEPRMRELTGDVMHDERTRKRGYFNRSFFEELSLLHRQQPNFYGEIVWYVVALELWQRRHFDRARDKIHAA